MRARVLACALALVAGAACGNGRDEARRPLVTQIGPAVAALEAELGAPQEYFEINATTQLVNLFVAGDGATAAIAYVYVGGELGPPAPAEPAAGATFSASALTFDPDTILDPVASELPDSEIVVFSVVGGPAGAVQYGVTLRSARGGGLDVVLAPDGEVRSVAPF